MLSLLLALTLSAAPLTIELGPTNTEHGLRVPSSGDGQNEAAERGGRPCRTVSGKDSHYLYVQTADAAWQPGDHDLYLTAELFDEYPQAVAVEYDHATPTPNIGTCYTPADSPFLLLGSGGWVKRTVRLTHARLGHGQNGGADLRLAGRVTVASLTLSDTPPAGYNADQPVPAAELERWRVRLPAAQELCVGCDPDPATAMLLKTLGVTSVESYVTWQTVEDSGRGQWDWSKWDKQAAILQAAGLKWVPFLIAGPAYATPKWFREGPDHLGYVDLNNGRATLIESLWNPRLTPEIERFLTAFQERYGRRGLIESVLLGITGTYGESIYPAGPEGGWTASITGPYYNGVGWWAGDKEAVAAFRAHLKQAHGTIAALNRAWGTTYADFDAVSTFVPTKAPSDAARVEFVRWYEDSMTEWSRWWVATTRRIVGQTPIYLCTGGAGEPPLGADFTAQAKAIAPYGAGIRITNEGSDYAANYSVTREVATATRQYKTFSAFEPAGEVNAYGVVARVYNATASGARQLHYYLPNLLDSGEAITNYRRSAPLLVPRKPRVPRVAVYMAREHWLDGGAMQTTYAMVRALRELCDLDLVTHDSVNDGVLAACRVLVIPSAGPTEAEPAIARFAQAGGLVMRADAAAAADLVTARRDGPAPARWRLDVGSPGDEPFLAGAWYHSETSAEFPNAKGTKRWSGKDPAVLVPLEPGHGITIELEAMVNGHSFDGGARAAVTLDGLPVGGLKAGHNVLRCEFPAEVIRNQVGRLAFSLGTWKPSDFGSGDGRDLGVALTRVEVWQAGATGEPVVNRGLAMAVDTARLKRTAQGRGAVVGLPVGGSDERQRALLLPLFRSLAPDCLDDDAFDNVFVTPLDRGRLLLNMSSVAVVKGGVTVPPVSIVEAP
ncbi:MAG: family 14 glycosylhydrolase [Armatimonadetes bacterium]|nr:family 14 glycosylhydrolase [Armatimonadota bacterium]